jgi:hypothetical protein
MKEYYLADTTIGCTGTFFPENKQIKNYFLLKKKEITEGEIRKKI